MAPGAFPEMFRVLPIVVILALAAPAYAGLDCDDHVAIKDLERFGAAMVAFVERCRPA